MKNPILFFLMALGFVTLFTNCQTDEALPGEGMLDEAFYLDHQFQVQVTNDLIVTFEEVTEDSRCPCNTDCFSAGQIGVKIKMETNGVALSKLENHQSCLCLVIIHLKFMLNSKNQR